jgi:hypothetical protein
MRGAAWLSAAVAILLGVTPGAGKPSNETAEYPVKLAFIYQLALYVRWPSDSFATPTTPLVVCVVGDDPFDPDLERELQSHSVDNHPIMVRKARRRDNLRTCHMVFVAAQESKQAAGVIGELKGAAILTIGESQGFAEQGGIVNFTVQQSKLHLEVNLDAARQTPLTISSRVLALARIVRGPPHSHLAGYSAD